MKWTKNALAALISTALLSGCFSDDEKASADAGDNLSVKERRAVQVSTATANGEGNVRIAWTQVSGPQLIISGANTLTPTFIAQSVDEDAEAVMRMIVTDAKGQVAEDEMSITISNNTLPQLNTQPEPIAEKTEVSVTADVSDDGEIRQVLWQQTGGPEVELSGEDSLTISFTSPAVTQSTALTFKLQVLDDDGEVAELEVVIEVLPTWVDVTLQGQVSGADFNGGSAELRGGAEQLSSNIDENGMFVFNLQLDDDALQSAVLSLEVTDANTGPIKYAALYSGFSTPQSQTTDSTIATILDDEIDSNVAQVTITAVSTALYALLVTATGGDVPADVTHRMLAEKSLDADELTEAAAVVKILTDNADFSLPEGVSSVLELLQDVTAYNTVVTQIDAAQPGLIATTSQAFLQEPMLTPPLTTESVAPLYFQTYSAAAGFLSRGGERWQFDADGSGVLAQRRGSADFSWQLSNGAIALNFAAGSNSNTSNVTASAGVAGLTQQQVDWLTADNISQVTMTSTVSSALLQRATIGQAIDTFRYSGERQLSVGPITTTQGVVTASSTEPFSQNVLMRKQQSTEAMFDPEQVSGTWALNTYFAQDLPLQGGEVADFYLDPLSFSASGTGMGTATGRNFSWQVVEGKLLLSMSDGSKVNIEIIDQSGNDYQVFTSVYDGADNLVAAQADYGFKAKLDGQAVPANLGSVYWQTMINSWDKHSWDNGRLLFCQGDSACAQPEQSYHPAFGWQFVTGGTGNQYYTGSPVGNLPPDFEFASTALSWVKTNPVSMNFSYGTNKRFWYILKEETGVLGRRLYVREEAYRTSDNKRTIGARLNIYEEIPLSYWNETAVQAPDSATGNSEDVQSISRKVLQVSPTVKRLN